MHMGTETPCIKGEFLNKNTNERMNQASWISNESRWNRCQPKNTFENWEKRKSPARYSHSRKIQWRNRLSPSHRITSLDDYTLHSPAGSIAIMDSIISGGPINRTHETSLWLNDRWPQTLNVHRTVFPVTFAVRYGIQGVESSEQSSYHNLSPIKYSRLTY